MIPETYIYTVVLMIKCLAQLLELYQKHQVCGTIAVIISIIPTTCIFRREKWRGFDRASGIERVFLGISL